MRHLHLAFIGVVFALILTILLAPTLGGGADTTADVPLERTYDVAPEGLVCCTWTDGAIVHSCVAASGQTCGVCEAVCA